MSSENWKASYWVKNKAPPPPPPLCNCRGKNPKIGGGGGGRGSQFKIYTPGWLAAHMFSPDQKIKNRLKVVVGSERAESWSQLSIQYAVPWPLHLIITPSAISRYNKVREAAKKIFRQWFFFSTFVILLTLDPDPHSSNFVYPDPIPHTINADPHHWFYPCPDIFSAPADPTHAERVEPALVRDDDEGM